MEQRHASQSARVQVTKRAESQLLNDFDRRSVSDRVDTHPAAVVHCSHLDSSKMSGASMGHSGVNKVARERLNTNNPYAGQQHSWSNQWGELFQVHGQHAFLALPVTREHQTLFKCTCVARCSILQPIYQTIQCPGAKCDGSCQPAPPRHWHPEPAQDTSYYLTNTPWTARSNLLHLHLPVSHLQARRMGVIHICSTLWTAPSNSRNLLPLHLLCKNTCRSQRCASSEWKVHGGAFQVRVAR